ncbi:hypothetical protein ACIBQX_46140 [Nonomuraea sp. NPDC049714]|uniref:hypothetical protein n=1 Tax=Nonomuraea sp. NPDC049714 TaxID=3364357 RepID=UPI0037AD045B
MKRRKKGGQKPIQLIALGSAVATVAGGVATNRVEGPWWAQALWFAGAAVALGLAGWLARLAAQPSTEESRQEPGMHETPGTPDTNHERLRNLLSIHERNVRILEAQVAKYAGDAPVHLQTQLEDELKRLEAVRERLRSQPQ